MEKEGKAGVGPVVGEEAADEATAPALAVPPATNLQEGMLHWRGAGWGAGSFCD